MCGAMNKFTHGLTSVLCEFDIVVSDIKSGLSISFNNYVAVIKQYWLTAYAFTWAPPRTPYSSSKKRG